MFFWCPKMLLVPNFSCLHTKMWSVLCCPFSYPNVASDWQTHAIPYIYIFTLPQCNCEYTDGRLYTCIPLFFLKRFPEPNPLGEIDPCAKRPHIPWTNCQCQAEPDVLTRYSAQSLTSSPVVGVQLGIGWSEVPPGDDARRNLPNWKSNGRVPPIFLEAWFRGSEFHHFFLKKGVKIIFQKRSTI